MLVLHLKCSPRGEFEPSFTKPFLCAADTWHHRSGLHILIPYDRQTSQKPQSRESLESKSTTRACLNMMSRCLTRPRQLQPFFCIKYRMATLTCFEHWKAFECIVVTSHMQILARCQRRCNAFGFTSSVFVSPNASVR